MQSKSNRVRILSELVSLEAWHGPLVFKETKPFYVALAFHDARYSGEDKSPVSFRVQLKRATLIVSCDENLRVPRDSKMREHPKTEQTIRTRTNKEAAQGMTAKTEIAGEVKQSLKDGTSSAVKGMAGLEAAQNQATGSELEVTQNASQRIRMIYRDSGNVHHWECQPIESLIMDGSAHDGKLPLMELTPKIDQNLQDMGVRVFVQCKADDFEITEIEVKKTVVERITGDNLKKRLSIAKAVLKEKLAEADLQIVDLDPKYQDVVIADIMAQVE